MAEYYKGETCSGCDWYTVDDGEPFCTNPLRLPTKQWQKTKPTDRCEEHFTPSLECRGVRAREDAALALKWIGYINAGGRNPPDASE